ncbi:MAG TPA: hypothetical protein PLS74_00425 [Bacteroidales bacterium]|nr:hypothetical protein [Bacteroidales bacterium]HPP93584.1 hypothetical protein [Bacteroidales bacterium]
MKNLDLNSIGVHEMSTLEMQETDGGIVWLLLVAGALLLGATSCNNGTITFQIGTKNSSDTNNRGEVSVDSTLNGNTVRTDITPY